jgi:hypothetical protein
MRLKAKRSLTIYDLSEEELRKSLVNYQAQYKTALGNYEYVTAAVIKEQIVAIRLLLTT